MGTLKNKWGPNGDPKSEKGPHGDPGPQMGTHLGAVHIKSQECKSDSYPTLNDNQVEAMWHGGAGGHANGHFCSNRFAGLQDKCSFTSSVSTPLQALKTSL